MTAFETLKEQVAQVSDILNAVSVLTWDARTQMPPGGAETRGEQLATLSSLAQERLTSERLKAALAEAEASSTDDIIQTRTLQSVREAVNLFERIPPALTEELARLKTVSQDVWAEARKRSDFGLFAPYLEQMVGLNQRLAEAIGYNEHPYDALLQQYEPDLTTHTLQDLFASLKEGILPLLERFVRVKNRVGIFSPASIPKLSSALLTSTPLSCSATIFPVDGSTCPRIPLKSRSPGKTFASPRVTTSTICR